MTTEERTPPPSEVGEAPRRGYVPPSRLDEVEGALQSIVDQRKNPNGISLVTSSEPSATRSMIHPDNLGSDEPSFSGGLQESQLVWKPIAPKGSLDGKPGEGKPGDEAPEPGLPPGVEQVPVERRPFVTKLWNGLKSAGAAYWENVSHIRGREKEWYVGVIAGAGLSLGLQAATAGNPVVSSATKFAINAGGAFLLNSALKANYINERASYKDKYTGQELKDKIANLEARHEKATGRVKNFFLGIPEPFEAIVNKMLAKKPADRPANTGQLLQELEALAKAAGVNV